MQKLHGKKCHCSTVHAQSFNTLELQKIMLNCSEKPVGLEVFSTFFFLQEALKYLVKHNILFTEQYLIFKH